MLPTAHAFALISSAEAADDCCAATGICQVVPYCHAETIRNLKEQTQQRLLVEALVPDFAGNTDSIRMVAQSGLDVYAHNIETVSAVRLPPAAR